MRNASAVGVGRVGVVTSACLAELGHEAPLLWQRNWVEQVHAKLGALASSWVVILPSFAEVTGR